MSYRADERRGSSVDNIFHRRLLALSNRNRYSSRTQAWLEGTPSSCPEGLHTPWTGLRIGRVERRRKRREEDVSQPGGAWGAKERVFPTSRHCLGTTITGLIRFHFGPSEKKQNNGNAFAGRINCCASHPRTRPAIRFSEGEDAIVQEHSPRG